MYRNRNLYAFAIFVVAFAANTTVFGQHQLSQNTSGDVKPLANGETIASEIPPMQKHRYAISLDAGQFVKIDLEEIDADLVMAFRSPDDVNLLDYADVEAVNGVKSVWAAASVKGVYELRIMNYGAVKGKPAYRVKIGELRPAKVEEIAFTDGMKIYNETFNPQSTDVLTAEIMRAKIEKGKKAQEKFSLAKATREEARAFWQMGVLSSRIGDGRQTIDFYRSSIEKSHQIADLPGEANTLRDLGTQYTKMSDWNNAFQCLAESLRIARETKRELTVADVLNLFGEAYAKFGDRERAAVYFQQSADIYLTITNVSRSKPLNNLGRISLAKGDAAKAEEYFRQAVETVRAENYRFGVTKIQEASILNSLGRAQYAMGKREKAIETISEALNRSREAGNRATQAASLKLLGKIYLDGADANKAAEHLQKSLELFRGIEDLQEIPLTLLLLSKAETGRNNLPAAQNNIDEAINFIERERSSVPIADLRDSFSASLQDFYAFYVELMMKRRAQENNIKFAELAFQASERARARGLLNLLAESKANIREAVDPRLTQKEIDLKNLLALRLENVTRVLSEKPKPGEPEKLKAEIEQIRADLEQTQAAICRTNPRYSDLTQPQTLTVREIQAQLLDESTSLLEYSLGRDKSFLWIVSKRAFDVVELPAKREIELASRNFYDALTARNQQIKFETPAERMVRIAAADAKSDTASLELSKLVFPASGAKLANKRLLIVADGALQYVPFAALAAPADEKTALGTGREFLIESNEIAYLPSASVMAVLRKDTGNRPVSPKTLAIFADPVFRQDDERVQAVSGRNGMKPKPMLVAAVGNGTRGVSDDATRNNVQLSRLPYTRREANAISMLVPPKQQEKLLDFAANRTSALSPELANYRYIHFATHGIIDNENPELSGIALSMFDANGKEQDGFLRVGDIYNLNLPVEMVVLSGCKTGLGREIRGEGLLGLTRGFMYAGAKRVTVSLWDVNDEATADLMSRFYREMLGEKKLQPAAALRQAQISMIKDKRWQNPYFWATFGVHGEPR